MVILFGNSEFIITIQSVPNWKIDVWKTVGLSYFSLASTSPDMTQSAVNINKITSVRLRSLVRLRSFKQHAGSSRPCLLRVCIYYDVQTPAPWTRVATTTGGLSWPIRQAAESARSHSTSSGPPPEAWPPPLRAASSPRSALLVRQLRGRRPPEQQQLQDLRPPGWPGGQSPNFSPKATRPCMARP